MPRLKPFPVLAIVGVALRCLAMLLVHSEPVPTGGLAVLRIRLLPLQGPSRNAVLEVNCALGDVPRERSLEGIRDAGPACPFKIKNSPQPRVQAERHTQPAV